jgi:hypothetical protein
LWRRMSHEVGEKLSNSGDSLKLLVPSNIRKNICGWISYSCMVTSQKMKETEMGYRGSKSITDFHKSLTSHRSSSFFFLFFFFFCK